MMPHFMDSMIAGVGGPGVTPPGVSWQEAASGWASASPIGSGPYLYRFLPFQKRFVKDYPSMNLSVRKSDFEKVGGFDSSFWPGEDTKLCHDLVYQLKKQILYSPQVIVYHHRRPIWLPHLQQISRYGFQRGRFVRLFPKTSRRFSYFLPLLLPPIFPLYFLALIITAVYYRSLFLAPVIFLTHLVYALYFLKGLLYQP